MIRVFTFIHKIDWRKIPNVVFLYHTLVKAFNPYNSPCPTCTAVGYLKWHDKYKRNLVTYENGNVQDNPILVKRVYCASCKTASAVLPDVLVPHKTYSLFFILYVLRAYILRKDTVVNLCSHFGISVTTLYAWKKRYTLHRKLHLGKLEKYLFEKDPYLKKPIKDCLFIYLHNFYKEYKFSFLQYYKAAESGST